MQKLAEICIRRPVFATMLILSLVVVGSAAYFNLGVDRLPSVDLPTVSVRATLPGAPPEQVETEVTEILEEVVNTVEGIDELRSISGEGTSAASRSRVCSSTTRSHSSGVRSRAVASWISTAH